MYDSATGLQKISDSSNLLFYVDKDDAGPVVIAANSGVPTEIDSTKSKGDYKIALAQGETDADKCHFTGKSTTSGIVVLSKTIYTIPNTGILAPATAGRTLVVDASGLADANAVKVGPTGSGTPQTARDLGASVLLSTGTGTGQLDFTSGVVKANATQLLGTAWLTPGTAGTPDVNAKLIGAIVPVQTSGKLWVLDGSGNAVAPATDSSAIKTKTDFLPSATAGATGGVFIAGSNAATTIAGLATGALSCTTLTASGAVAFQSTFAVTTSTSLGAFSCTTLTASGAVAFQSTFAVTTSTSLAALSCSTLTASGAVAFQSTWGVTGAVTFTAGLTSNITGTLSTVTTLTNLPAIPTNWLTATGIAATALNGKGDWLLSSSYTAPPTTGAIATAVWTDLLVSSDFSTVSSIGALLKADINAPIGSIPTNPYTGTPPTVAQIWTTALTESYAANGAAFTAAQGLFMVWSLLSEFAISGTSYTSKKLDGSTTSMVFTLDSGTSPTSLNRSS